VIRNFEIRSRRLAVYVVIRLWPISFSVLFRPTAVLWDFGLKMGLRAGGQGTGEWGHGTIGAQNCLTLS